jgi:biopolymer transport protein TolQ
MSENALSQRRNLLCSEARLLTLGWVFVALLLQAPESSTSIASSSIVAQLARSSFITKFVLLALAVLSIVSWSIILYKLWTFSRSSRQSRSFLDVFRRSNKFSEVQAVCRSLRQSPLVGLFQAGYTELTAQLRQNSPPAQGPAASSNPSTSSNPSASPGRPILKSLTAVDRALMRASIIEVNKLERRIPFLATTASIAPFIGLFGTVWGIMSAFQNIGQTGSTNLGIVAGPIAEALIATAAGLAAAIPAVYFYNLLTQRVKVFAAEMDDFAMEFLNIAERNFT